MDPLIQRDSGIGVGRGPLRSHRSQLEMDMTARIGLLIGIVTPIELQGIASHVCVILSADDALQGRGTWIRVDVDPCCQCNLSLDLENCRNGVADKDRAHAIKGDCIAKLSRNGGGANSTPSMILESGAVEIQRCTVELIKVHQQNRRGNIGRRSRGGGWDRIGSTEEI